VSIVLFVLVGFEVEPEVLAGIDILGFGLAFFAASFFPFGTIVINRRDT
jgi:hypothetical protein